MYKQIMNFMFQFVDDEIAMSVFKNTIKLGRNCEWIAEVWIEGSVINWLVDGERHSADSVFKFCRRFSPKEEIGNNRRVVLIEELIAKHVDILVKVRADLAVYASIPHQRASHSLTAAAMRRIKKAQIEIKRLCKLL